MKNENAVVIKKTNIVDASNPTDTIQAGTDIANVLKNVIDEQKLYSNIKGKKYVQVEGWTTLATILNLRPIITSTERLDKKDEVAYTAHCEVRDYEDRIVGSADAMCSNKEGNWKGRDEYAIMSMSQTRSISKALRLPLGWIMTLAGYSATPSEEMTGIQNRNKSRPERPRRERNDKPPKPNEPEGTVDGEVKIRKTRETKKNSEKELDIKELEKKPHLDTAIETLRLGEKKLNLKNILTELQNMLGEDTITQDEFNHCKKELGLKT